VNKCLHTVASSWTFLLTLNHDARNHEFKIKSICQVGSKSWDRRLLSVMTPR